jgi:protein TonB
MFEQTFLSEPKTARKPYSMVLSLLLQILVIGVLCLLPIVFTEVLPSMQLKDVLAAPPKPPAALKWKAAATRLTTASPRALLLSNLPLKNVRAAPSRPAELGPPPSLDVGDSGTQGGVPYGVMSAASMPSAPPPAAKPKPQPQVQKPIRVGSISAANLVHMVQPVYPAIARANRIQGTVEFTATISREGAIENLTLVRGHPLLIQAAREAVLQWRYRPTLLNGEPVEVITDIVVNFTLNQ